jgi:methionine-rich copper-binding protein CopC
VGATVDTPPGEVRIWFDGEIEPVFSTIRVENGDKQRVDRGDAKVASSDRRLLQVSVGPLGSGKYRVFWSVVARDGHRTEGDFPFRVR